MKKVPKKNSTTRSTAKRATLRKDILKDLFRFLLLFKAHYFITVLAIGVLIGLIFNGNSRLQPQRVAIQKEYWMVLERSKNLEYLYLGVPGDESKSILIKRFNVKTGIPNERPTPLPSFLGKKYWKIVKKYPSIDNPETSPYFLELDIPVEDGVYGPVPYSECGGEQCSWELPGYFGLHGVNGDFSKLSAENTGSSGCIRHTDADITYLYNLLEVDEGVRYYVRE